MPKKHTYQWSRENEGDDFARTPSRSQRKRDSTALQELGARLTTIPATVLATLPIADDLRDAVLEYQKLAGHEARRRQLQFIGRLMREESNPKAVQDALEALSDKDASDAIRFRHIEEQRETFISTPPEQCAELCTTFGLPPERSRKIAELAARARNEREQKHPPHAFRALFRLLRELSELSVAARETGNDTKG